jgi:hypothetical protein
MKINNKKLVWILKIIRDLLVFLFATMVFIESLQLSVGLVVPILGLVFFIGIMSWVWYNIELLLDQRKGWK